jgi:RNA polymerase sigma-70 factor (ECF subfamily)
LQQGGCATEHDTPTDSRDDQSLIDAINDGDEQSFGLLYQKHRDWVVRLAIRLGAHHDLALDVLQETFLYVARKFPGFELTAKFTTFLYPVVRHITIAQRQKASRLGQVDTLPEPASQPPTQATDLDDLAAVLADLSAGHREVILLRFVDGMKIEEIAEAMQIPLGTVKSRLHHALGTLRADERVKKYFEQ